LLCKLCLKPCKTYSLEEKFYTKEDIVALEINDGVCPWIVKLSLFEGTRDEKRGKWKSYF
jgi:hypothetical protein